MQPSKFSSRHLLVLAVLLLVIGLAAYGNILLRGKFIFDDYAYIVENPVLQEPEALCVPTDSRLVAFWTFALQRAVSGLDPFPFHLFNVLTHVMNAALVFLVIALLIRLSSPDDDAGGLLGPLGIPFLTALLFLVHPLATQSVSSITQRFTSLAAFFYLLSVFLYLEARMRLEQGTKCRFARGLFAGAVLAALLGMKTKEICFTLPITLLVLDLLFFPGAVATRRRFLHLIPFFLVALVVPLSLYGPEWGILPESPAGVAAEMRGEKVFDLENRSSYEYLLTQSRVIVRYLRLLFVPHPLTVVYDIKASTTFFSLPVIASFLLLASLFAAGCRLIVRPPRHGLSDTVLLRLAGIGIIWFFITISVESSVIPIKDLIFEHRTYLPSAGFVLAVVALAGEVLRRLRPDRALRNALTLFLPLSLILGLMTFQRNQVWADEVDFWDDAVAHAPARPLVWNNRAMVLFQRGDYRAALHDMDRSVELAEEAFPRGVAWDNPDISRAMMASTYENRAKVHDVLGNAEAATADRVRAENVMMTGTMGLRPPR